jgi:hypothetical protein
MIVDDINLFLSGAVFMGEFVTAVLFLRFWRRTGDRLFGWFAAAFFVLMAERVLLFWYAAGHVHPAVYTARLASFVLIIIAVIDRNRRTQ